MKKLTDISNVKDDAEETETKKWIHCDFCRVQKKTKFNRKHIEVSNTDAGQFQGPTCFLSINNTETVPLSEEKKAALEAEKAKGKKKKKELKPGLTPEEKQKVLDEEYKEMLRATAEEEKENRKIALEQIKHETEEFKTNVKPAWFQEFSYKQMFFVESLGESLRRDLLEGNLIRTPVILAGLGLNPLPSIRTVYKAAYKCFMNPLIFLLYLYKHYGKTPLKKTEKYFCPNDRLILSAVTYIALPRTLLELHIRLPVFPRKAPKYYPGVERRKEKTYSSPYLEPQPLLKHCNEKNEKEAIKLRRKYLYKLKLLKALEAEEKKIELQMIAGGRTTQSMPYSRKPDAQDQIQEMMNNQAPPRQSLKPDKKYPRPSWKRKKSYCANKKRRRPKKILPSACGAYDCRLLCTPGKRVSEVDAESTVTTELLIHQSPQPPSPRLDNVTETEEEMNEENKLSGKISQNERIQSKNENLNENTENKNVMDEENDTPLILPEESEELRKKLHELILEGGTAIYENASSKNITQQEDADVSNIGNEQASGLLYIGFEFRGSTDASNDYLTENTKVRKKKYRRPIFLTLKDQFPRPSWCIKDYTIQPIFSTAVCGYVPSEAEKKAREAESIQPEDSEAFLHWKCLRLPFPIPTIPTLKAVITGYWQNTLYTFRAPKLTKSEVNILKTGGEEIFIVLAKNALANMAENGNPLACLPDVHYMPAIRQLIRDRVNFKLTEKIKDKLMLKSLEVWDRIIGQPRRTKLIDMEMKRKKYTWSHIVEFKKMVHIHAVGYRRQVRQALLDDARDCWSSMFMDYFDNPGFRSVFFCYMPSKENDILFPIP